MRKYILFALLAIALMFAPALFGQTQTVTEYIAYSDTISNGVGATFDVDLSDDYSRIDSVKFSYFAQGEVDIDQMTFKRYYTSPTSFPYKSTHTTFTYTPSSVDSTQTITTNLDSANTAYAAEQYVITDMSGYNAISGTITGASSGCDEDDPGQKVVLIARVYGVRE